MTFRRFFDGGNQSRTIPYSDPYIDIGQFNLPPSMKSLMTMCRRLFLTHPVIFPAIWKISNYPITDFKFEAATPSIRTDYKTVFVNQLRIKQVCQLMNLDFNAYGNGVGSPVFPFDKWLICPLCNFESLAKNTRYRFNATGQFDYQGQCSGCRKKVTFEIEDRPLRRAWNRLRIMRWPPLSLDIDHNPYTGESIYYHRIPRELRAIIAGGNILLTSTLPIDFIKCCRLGKRIKLNRDNLYHMARPSISDTRVSFGPWGVPMLLPVAKTCYTRAIITRSQEAMAQNRILPLRMLWPQMGNQATPIGGINLGNWRARMEEEVKIWMRDPNYIGISPIPIGMGTVGSDARPLLLGQELDMLDQSIVQGMGIPKGFVFGDMTFSSASVTLRMMENELLASRVELLGFVDFLRERIQTYMDWPYCRMSFTNLRMADDMQRLQMLLNLNQMGKIPDKEIVSEFGYDYEQVKKQRRIELENDYDVQKMSATRQAEAQGLAQMIATKYQFEAQQSQMEMSRQAQEAAQLAGMDPGAMYEPNPQEAQQEGPQFGEHLDAHAQEFAQMSPEAQQQQLQAMQTAGNPGYAQAVQKRAVDMRPLPEQKPPTRSSALI